MSQVDLYTEDVLNHQGVWGWLLPGLELHRMMDALRETGFLLSVPAGVVGFRSAACGRASLS